MRELSLYVRIWRLYTSESDVYRRQNLTYQDGSSAEKVNWNLFSFDKMMVHDLEIVLINVTFTFYFLLCRQVGIWCDNKKRKKMYMPNLDRGKQVNTFIQ